MRPEQRPGFQIVGGQGFGIDGLLDGFLLLAIAELRQIPLGQAPLIRRQHNLYRFTIAIIKAGAQGFVPLHQFPQHFIQYRHLQRPLDTQRAGHVVGDIMGIQLIQYPKPLLAERSDQRLIPGYGFNSGFIEFSGLAQKFDDGRFVGHYLLFDIRGKSTFRCAEAQVFTLQPKTDILFCERSQKLNYVHIFPVFCCYCY